MRIADSVLVYVLTARSADRYVFDFKILFVDFDYDVLDLWKHGYGNGGRMDTPLRLGVGNALNAMNAAFEFEPRKQTVARDRENGFLYASEFGSVYVHVLDLPAVLFGVHFVHTHKFGGEQSGFVSARAPLRTL